MLDQKTKKKDNREEVNRRHWRDVSEALPCQLARIRNGGKTKMAPEKGVYEVVWPRGKRPRSGVVLAKRLDTLNGKTVAEVWDWIFHGDEMFAVIEKELAKRYPGIRFVSYEKFGNIHGAEEAKVLAALPDRLQQNKCDAVISGVGC